MKKEQTRNVPYPVYPTYPGMNQMMMGPMPYGYPNMNPMGISQMSGNCSSNTTELSSLKEEVDNLKKRVSYLENNLLSNYNNNYNSSNYQVM